MTGYCPESLNIELTTRCPFHCPQCYCSLEGGKNIPLDVLTKKLEEAGRIGVKTVQLSGGETMCYPHLYEAIKLASVNCGSVNVAVSGYRFDKEALQQMIDAGVNSVFVSLNGSTKELNDMTRDGYEQAINALKVLSDAKFKNTYINWVMHSYNAEDFPNVVAISEKYNISDIVVLALKPDSQHQLKSLPSKAQMNNLSKFIKSYRGKTNIQIEACFSPLLALHMNSFFFGNLNNGPTKGCRAGLYNYCINVDGKYSPCRHLDYFEKWDTLEEYWNNSPILQKIRSLEESKREPCTSCKYCNYCRHCLAINSKLNNDLYIGNEFCQLAGSV